MTWRLRKGRNRKNARFVDSSENNSGEDKVSIYSSENVLCGILVIYGALGRSLARI